MTLADCTTLSGHMVLDGLHGRFHLVFLRPRLPVNLDGFSESLLAIFALGDGRGGELCRRQQIGLFGLMENNGAFRRAFFTVRGTPGRP